MKVTGASLQSHVDFASQCSLQTSLDQPALSHPWIWSEIMINVDIFSLILCFSARFVAGKLTQQTVTTSDLHWFYRLSFETGYSYGQLCKKWSWLPSGLEFVSLDTKFATWNYQTKLYFIGSYTMTCKKLWLSYKRQYYNAQLECNLVQSIPILYNRYSNVVYSISLFSWLTYWIGCNLEMYNFIPMNKSLSLES